MKKYLLAFITLLPCSSFISIRIADDGKGTRTLRICPKNEDSTTYLLREYQPFHVPLSDTTADEYLIKETLYFNAELKRETICHVRGKDISLYESQFLGGGVYEYKRRKTLFEDHTLYLSGRMWLEIRYQKNGLIDELRLNSWRNQNTQEVVKCDEQNLTYWTGIELYKPKYDTSFVYTNEEEITTIKATDIYKKVGLWRRYDGTGAVTDSMLYDKK